MQLSYWGGPSTPTPPLQTEVLACLSALDLRSHGNGIINLELSRSYIAMVPCANLVGFAGQELARKVAHVYGVLVETTSVLSFPMSPLSSLPPSHYHHDGNRLPHLLLLNQIGGGHAN